MGRKSRQKVHRRKQQGIPTGLDAHNPPYSKPITTSARVPLTVIDYLTPYAYGKSKETMRSCGECTACCSHMGVKGLGKPSGCDCVHLGKGGAKPGCTIYNSRPDDCKEFECLWRAGFGSDEDRPDKSGIILAPVASIDYTKDSQGKRSGELSLSIVEIREGAIHKIASVNPNYFLDLLPFGVKADVYMNGVLRTADYPISPDYADQAPPAGNNWMTTNGVERRHLGIIDEEGNLYTTDRKVPDPQFAERKQEFKQAMLRFKEAEKMGQKEVCW